MHRNNCYKNIQSFIHDSDIVHLYSQEYNIYFYVPTKIYNVIFKRKQMFRMSASKEAKLLFVNNDNIYVMYE